MTSPSFNSQPREGGWALDSHQFWKQNLFQLAAARRRLEVFHSSEARIFQFQLAAARRRLVLGGRLAGDVYAVSTRSRAKAAGRLYQMQPALGFVSTRSRAKAAGSFCVNHSIYCSFQLAAARRRLGASASWINPAKSFQLAAARRRLDRCLKTARRSDVFQLAAARRRLDGCC